MEYLCLTHLSLFLLGIFCPLGLHARATDCPEGLYGKKCEKRCSPGCYGGCQRITGQCLHGCGAGWTGDNCLKPCQDYRYGPDCRLQCGHCHDDEPCAPATGTCVRGCEAGLRGHQCKQGCEPYTYGPGCVYKCGHCRLQQTCNPVTGLCPGGCAPGWMGARCDQACANGTHGVECSKGCGMCADNSTCHHVTGRCEGGCQAGWTGPHCTERCEPYTYGPGCVYKCGHCRLQQTCNPVTGLCPGGCAPGWMGARCDQACANGTHGVECSKGCGMCADNSTCHHVTGRCEGGCQAGWTGPHCTERCGAGRFGSDCSGTCGRCLKGTCDHVTGICDFGCARGWSGDLCQEECMAGQFGTNCSQACGHCVNATPCDSVNGLCSQGCAPGWRGVFCTMECAPGFYGRDCQYNCGNCRGGSACMTSSGRCPKDCEDGWAGPNCDQALVAETGPLQMESLLPAVVVVTVVVVVVAAVAAVYCFVLRPRVKPASLNRLYTEGQAECTDPIRNAYEQISGGPWDIPRSSLVLTTQLLGNGHFGQVKKGFVRMRGAKIPVAIKSLKENASEKDKRDFLNELVILKQVGKHTNVVCLVGACHIRGVMYVAMEYAKHGDLRSFLRKSRKLRQHEYGNCGSIPFVSKTMLLRFALGAAQGMRHLAEKQIIHRDLAARNVLLGDHLVAKIADFGLSKNDETYVKTSSTRVPIRWMAVESLFNNTYTTQSDVWSFGVVLWEIFTLGGTPYSSTDTQQLFAYLKDGYRLKRPKICDQNTYAMMLQCWNETAERRPTFSELCGRLQRMLDDCQVYMNLSTEEESLYAEIEQDEERET
ncbi:tyrosine-protein kinase receptor Tie-1-like [Littorina saxatilis]|uniref:tyrosine-protein kinase receptor Tie-1-like n=1 Tax=Littorina saxatilis TaxID=31220 RepID=UPI0038B4FE1D